MPTRRTSAVVIKVSDYGESDKIVTFYCRDVGKLTGIAKGAKRSKKRFVNKLELFSLLDMHYAVNNRTTLARIEQAELCGHFRSLSQHYDRYSAAALICELVTHWTRENDGDSELFALLTWALTSLDAGEPVIKILILFQTKLFSILGYQPRLSACGDCGTLNPERGPYRFSAGRSSMICGRCNAADTPAGGHIPLSLNTARLLHKAQELPRHKLGRLQFSPASTREALTLLRRYGSYLLQRDIQSWNHLPGFGQVELTP